ncbi:MAG: 5'/3'-nucleotidase SurE [Synergistaceae bacterium]|nr:5'/3'-nucleotidase SurE [Synergistota bacterium]NLM70880.1 5'/3'-nucleotidase SurE [Synergistaceae bacterium]
MKLLITNDDGVLAPGIVELVRRLSEHGEDCTVVAPDRERSSTGHSVTLTRPLKLWPVEEGLYPDSCRVYACDGTPSDCVLLGLEVIRTDADMVLAGINRGPNLGDDLTYSGTVSAAMEGLLLGRPSMAFSLDCREEDEEHHYGTVSAVARALVDRSRLSPLPKEVLLSVNVPNLPLDEIRGTMVTRKGVRRYEEKVNRMKDPTGRSCYWVMGRAVDLLDEGSDVWAVAHGYVSITPVHMDMTHYPSLESLVSDGLEKINFS